MEDKKMSVSDLVPEARAWLRSVSTVFDSEIADGIAACSLDLINGGVSKEKAYDYADPLIRQAVKLHLKAFFGYDDDADRFSKAYEFLKKSLEISGDYRG